MKALIGYDLKFNSKSKGNGGVFLLNEKTLELNIASEFLNICRRYDPQSFVFGTTLRQEAYLGYDSRVLGRLPPFWRTAIFQFKKVVRWSHMRNEYVFRINNNRNRDQHAILYMATGGQPRIAFYVLPILTTLDDVRTAAPNLLRKTLFADVADIPPWITNNLPHYLIVYPQWQLGVLRSKEYRIGLLSFEDLLGN